MPSTKLPNFTFQGVEYEYYQVSANNFRSRPVGQNTAALQTEIDDAKTLLAQDVDTDQLIEFEQVNSNGAHQWTSGTLSTLRTAVAGRDRNTAPILFNYNQGAGQFEVRGGGGPDVDITLAAVSGGTPAAFTGNTDTPNSYAGAALQFLRTNAAEDAVEFVALIAALVGFDNATAALPGTNDTVQQALESLKGIIDGLPEQLRAADITARDAALAAADENAIIHVDDASADAAVTAGWAKYQKIAGAWTLWQSEEKLTALISAITDAQLQDRTDTTVGLIQGGKQLFDLWQANQGTAADHADGATDEAVGKPQSVANIKALIKSLGDEIDLAGQVNATLTDRKLHVIDAVTTLDLANTTAGARAFTFNTDTSEFAFYRSDGTNYVKQSAVTQDSAANLEFGVVTTANVPFTFYVPNSLDGKPAAGAYTVAGDTFYIGIVATDTTFAGPTEITEAELGSIEIVSKVFAQRIGRIPAVDEVVTAASIPGTDAAGKRVLWVGATTDLIVTYDNSGANPGDVSDYPSAAAWADGALVEDKATGNTYKWVRATNRFTLTATGGIASKALGPEIEQYDITANAKSSQFTGEGLHIFHAYVAGDPAATTNTAKAGVILRNETDGVDVVSKQRNTPSYADSVVLANTVFQYELDPSKQYSLRQENPVGIANWNAWGFYAHPIASSIDYVDKNDVIPVDPARVFKQRMNGVAGVKDRASFTTGPAGDYRLVLSDPLVGGSTNDQFLVKVASSTANLDAGTYDIYDNHTDRLNQGSNEGRSITALLENLAANTTYHIEAQSGGGSTVAEAMVAVYYDERAYVIDAADFQITNPNGTGILESNGDGTGTFKPGGSLSRTYREESGIHIYEYSDGHVKMWGETSASSVALPIEMADTSYDAQVTVHSGAYREVHISSVTTTGISFARNGGTAALARWSVEGQRV